MAYNLHCLLTNGNQIQLIKAAMRNISDTIISAKSDAKVTARGLYNQLKKAGVDIDLESTAAIYSDEFANDIVQYKNFETPEQLEEYKTKYPPVSKDVKAALIAAGYSKTLKNGTTILDWTKLMSKSEDEIRDEIKDLGLPNENAVFNALQNEWKQIVSTALIKAKNDLSQRNKDITPSERTAIDKIADLHVKGLFGDFKDDYQNAIHKAIGTSRETLSDLQIINQLGRTARLLQNARFGTNNFIAQQLQAQINAVISKARFRDANWFYKIVKSISNLFEFANLSILNNLSNRSQNFVSGLTGRTMSSLQYGTVNRVVGQNTEISKLAQLTKRDIIRGGGVDFGEVNNMFNGDRSSTDAVREFLTSLLPTEGSERAGNWIYNQLMGTAALNGVDSYFKVKNTWTRFVSNAEDILVSKGMSKQDAQKEMNKQLFGDTWEKARGRAEKVMRGIKSKGGTITINEETIERFTGDVVKAQLLENKILTSDQLSGAWDAAYTTAGMEMGHVTNNYVTTQLNALKTKSHEGIENALSKGQYSKAAYLSLVDIFTSKIIFRFLGGGTNWLVLKLEKGGLGVVMGLGGRVVNNADFKNKKNLANMSAKDIEETLTNIQKSNDQIARGTAGLIANAAILTLAQYVYGCEKPECKEKKKKLMDWMERNKWSNKYINNLVPFYLTAYVAYERQKRMGISETFNERKYSPLRSYAYNFFNQQEESQVVKLFQGAGQAMFAHKKSVHDKAMGEMGEAFGQYFNIDPLPYRVFKDIYTVYEGTTGNINQKFIKPESIWEGYLKFGITDWPKLKSDKNIDKDEEQSRPGVRAKQVRSGSY